MSTSSKYREKNLQIHKFEVLKT